MKPITLTHADWEEIWYALEARVDSPVTDEDVSDPDYSGWRPHLKRIMETIGVDGEDAGRCGVAPNK